MAHSHGGAKIGTKVANVVSRAIVATHGKLVGTKHRLAMLIFHSISDMISSEVHVSLDRTLVSLWEKLPEDSPAKPLVGFMANETGQLQAGAGISAVAGSVLGSISLIINNELAPGVQGFLSTNPHLIPDSGTIAGLAAAGITDRQTAINNIAYNGMPAAWATALIESNFAYPDPSSALDMYRRGIIGHSQFEQWAALNKIPTDVIAAYEQLIDTPISPADAALAYLRGNLSESDAQNIASQWGVSPDSFTTLVDNTGEPLGLMQLLEAYRRNFIDKATLEKGILQSRVRDEWIGTAEQLAFSPMTTADAVNAVVQGHMTQADAEKIASQNGLEDGALDTLIQTAGAPLSRTEMEDLFNRGLVTEDQVNQALSESRLKNKYNSLAFALHNRLIEVGALSDAVQYGAITHDQAVQKVMLHGYAADDAAILVSSAVNRKLESERRAVMTSVVALYEANSIALSDAQTMASNLGFEASEADFILQAAEFRRNQKLVTAAMNAVRSKFIGHHITQQEAQSFIDALGVPSTERDQVIQLWTIEQEANVRTLTPAQVVAAVTNNLITNDDGMARLQNMGYNATDATLLIQGA